MDFFSNPPQYGEDLQERREVLDQLAPDSIEYFTNQVAIQELQMFQGQHSGPWQPTG